MRSLTLIYTVFLVLIACPATLPNRIGNVALPHVVRGLSIEEKIVREAGPQLAPLALAIAWRESRFNAKAISRTRDLGVFQIHASTAVALHLWHPLDVDQNIVAGVGLLRVGYEMYGSEAGARCFFEHPARCGGIR